MYIRFACPKCSGSIAAAVDSDLTSLVCPQCSASVALAPGGIEGDQVKRCLVCPSADLFVRKDFPQRLGVGVVVLGIVASSIAWGFFRPIETFAILFATALVDVALYFIVPDVLMCYRCGAEYRGVEEPARHGAFNLETHERYRQQLARTGGHH